MQMEIITMTSPKITTGKVRESVSKLGNVYVVHSHGNFVNNNGRVIQKYQIKGLVTCYR